MKNSIIKKKGFWVLALMIVFAGGVVLAKRYPRDIEIYLATNEVPTKRLMMGALKIEDFVLEERPIFSRGDFVSVDLGGGGFRVNAQSALRFGKRMFPQPTVVIDGEECAHLSGYVDTPFVLFRNGKPVHWGVFTSDYSSTLYDAPMIRPRVPDFPVGSKRSIRFQVENLGD